jgi:NAD(P)-dependent dehydrogenase (short-subunit alcohol dehydrogenase family)/acyl dehydratase
MPVHRKRGRVGVVSSMRAGRSRSRPRLVNVPSPAVSADPGAAQTSRPIRFSVRDLDLFALASHDVNPLHVSAAYARRTAYGDRVGHGMLAVLACLGRLPATPGTRLQSVGVEFNAPVFAELGYRAEIRTNELTTTVRLVYGQRVVLKLKAQFCSGEAANTAPHAGIAARARANPLTFSELASGWELSGSYGPQPTALDFLLQRCQVADGPVVGKYHATVLMALSYLVGMEAPGEAALFSGASVTFVEPAPPHDGTIDYRLVVREQDARFDLVRMDVGFAVDGSPIASAAIEAFVRPAAVSLNAELLRRLSPRSGSLAGRSALVVGGSRGLGAAIALALADQQCTTGLCFAQSRDAAESVASAAIGGNVELIQVDASDLPAFEHAARDFCERHGGLDFLICCACPPLFGTSFHAECMSRISEYISQSIALAAIPLATTLGFLDKKAGTVVMISSSALTNPPRDWPHYITAKSALEGLVRAALASARHVRALIVRPPRLLTDLVNSPGAHHTTLEPEVVAATVVSQLARPAGPGISLLDDFAGLDAPAAEH